MSERSESLRCYYPGRRFPALSVTGGGCALGCAHCEGRLLSGMRAVKDLASLLAEAERIADIGGSGFLLSGGCDRDGKVPLLPFIGAVAEAKRRWGLKANLHPGLLDEREALDLSRSGADCYSVDLHQSERVIRDVLHLDRQAKDYELTLDALVSAHAGPMIPHVTVGLDDDGEDAFRSIELASRFDIGGLVALVFTPIEGTALGLRSPPTDELVLEVLERAKSNLNCPVHLGCMRPRRNPALEIAAIRSGVRDMAMPSSEAVEWARAEGLSVERIERCCAVHL